MADLTKTRPENKWPCYIIELGNNPLRKSVGSGVRIVVPTTDLPAFPSFLLRLPLPVPTLPTTEEKMDYWQNMEGKSSQEPCKQVFVLFPLRQKKKGANRVCN